MSLYDVDLAKRHPEGALLLAVIAETFADLRRRRDLHDAAVFLLGERVLSICDPLGIDHEALRVRALRLCPDLPRWLSDSTQPAKRHGGPPPKALCQRGHPIVSYRGKRLCVTCRRARQREAARLRRSAARRPLCGLANAH